MLFYFQVQKELGKHHLPVSSQKVLTAQIKKGAIEPCNVCSNCISITKGTCVDVIEMDAASNRRIDEIRELIVQVIYTPVICTYKVYIIDEVHMLTKEAFNALLKTLEEPPKFVIFILATTEPDKLPTTIRSRCLTIEFARAKKTELVHMLKRICTAEKLTLSDEILQEISLHADHSFRDAAKLLEEFISAYKSPSDRSSLDVFRKHIGLRKDIHIFLTFLQDKKTQESLTYLSDYEKQGGNPKILIESCMSIFHKLILHAYGLPIDLIHTYTLTRKDLIILIKSFTEAWNTMKYSPIEILPLEIAIAEFCNA